jgi:Flp pilus assembly pilin Flp
LHTPPHPFFPSHTKGAALVEHATLVALVGALALGAVLVFGDSLSNVFQTADTNVASASEHTPDGGNPQAVPSAYVDPYFLSMPTVVTNAGVVSSNELMAYQYGPGDLALNTAYAAYWRSNADWAVVSATPEADAYGPRTLDTATGDLTFPGPWPSYCETDITTPLDGNVVVQGALPSGEIREIVYTLVARSTTC